MLQQLPASKRHEILLRGCKAIPTTSHHLIWAVRSQQQSLRRYERLLTTGLGGRPGSLPPSTCIPETLLVPFPPLPLPPPASGCICTKKKKKKKKKCCGCTISGNWYCACPTQDCSAPRALLLGRLYPWSALRPVLPAPMPILYSDFCAKASHSRRLCI